MSPGAGVNLYTVLLGVLHISAISLASKGRRCTLSSRADASVKPVRLYGRSTKVCASTTCLSCSAASCKADSDDATTTVLVRMHT